MTDHTYSDALVDADHGTARTGFFTRRAAGVLSTLMEDFRAVPGEAWIILAVATVSSNLFIALA